MELFTRAVIVLLFGLYELAGHAQQIYTINEGSELQLLDVSSCELLSSFILTNPINGADLQPFDIAIAADGFLYFVDNATLYRVDLATSEVSIVGFNINLFYTTGLTGTSNGNLISYDELGNILLINPSNASSTNLGNSGFLPGGDITFFNGELYLVSGENQIVLVDQSNPALSTPVLDIGIPDEFFWGMTSVVDSCEEQLWYATSLFGIVQIDIVSGTVTEVCEAISNSPFYGATSTTNFLAEDCNEDFESPNEIEVSIDLDADDSSGAGGADFNAGLGCAPSEFPLADSDALLVATSAIESLVITLTGILDAGSEFISIQELAGIEVIDNNTGAVQIDNVSGIDNDALAGLLAASVYVHTGPEYTPGLRTITVTAFLEEVQSNSASTFIELVQPDAGEGGVISLCQDESIDANNLLSDGATQGGLWLTPDGQPFSGVFSFGMEEGEYSYSVSIGDCTQTSEWTFTNNQAAGGFFEVESTVCLDSCTGSIAVFLNTGTVLLAPFVSAVDTLLIDLCRGEYIFLFESSDGCQAEERLFITADNDPEICGLGGGEDEPIYVPNAFTPDGDNVNEVFRAVSAAEFRSFTMKVFNRWGEKVFESDDINTPWIGNAFGGEYYVPNGVYAWVIEYAYLSSAQTGRLAGHVVVVR